MISVSFAPPALPSSGALALLVAEGASPAGLREKLDADTGGGLERALRAGHFTGKKGQTCVVLAPTPVLDRVVVVGLGKPDEHTVRGMEEAAGTALALMARDETAAVATDGMPPEHAAAGGLGAVLRGYRFDRYRTKEAADDKPRLKALTVLTDDPAAAQALWPAMEARATGVFLTRDLVSEPPNILTPAEFAERCRELGELGVEVEVMGPDELKRAGFGALMGVAQGSANEPRVVVMCWRGGEEGAKPLVVAGKGVTFDTGGVSIKPANGMEDMKWDMAGAGTVAGLMSALAGRRARANVVGIIGLVENMLDGHAQRPGDVVRSLSGQTIEVLNTDAEGRLVLADVIWYAQERFDPSAVIDLATLTGAIIVSLGHEYAGLYSTDDTLAARLLGAGTETGEKLWRMPLGEAYDKLLKSDIADMKNIGGRPGGANLAACFIGRFTNGKPWAHLDIAGTAWSRTDAPCVPKGATAYGVRLLDRLVADHYEG